MNYIVRDILQEEYSLLEKFLYEAIFVPEGMDAHRNPSSSSRNCRCM